MATDDASPVTLRLTTRSIVVAVAMLGVTLAIIRVFPRASRSLSWVLVAVVVAAILLPAVSRLSRRIPRPLAIVTVLLGVGLVVGGVVLSGIDDLENQANRLERALPDAARELEESAEFGEVARAFDLAERTQTFVDDLPRLLEGGSEVEALRSAATRGAAFLATTIMTLFMIVYGPRFVRSGLDQIADAVHRDHVEATLTRAYQRSWRYLVLMTLKAFVAGAFTTAVCLVADVPAPILLGIWVGVWSFVPALGVVVGSIPVVMLSAITSIDTAAVILVVFVAYQLFDVLVVQPQITRRSVHVGPALTLAVGLLGFTLYGVGGLVFSVILLMFGVAVLDTLAPDEEGDLQEGVQELLSGPDDATVDTIAPA